MRRISVNPEGSDPVSSSVQVCWGPGYGPEEETHTGASGNGGTGASGVLVLGGWALSDCGSPQGVTPGPSYQGNARTNGGSVSPAQTWWAGPCTPGSLSGAAGNQMAAALQLVSPSRCPGHGPLALLHLIGSAPTPHSLAAVPQAAEIRDDTDKGSSSDSRDWWDVVPPPSVQRGSRFTAVCRWLPEH